MRVETLTPVVQAAPGARARWRLRIENDSSTTVGYRLRVIGFDPAHVIQPPPRAPLEAGSSDELDLDLVIPEAFAAGYHSIAIEVTPDRAGVAPVIAAVTVTVGTIDEVALAVVPSTIRARRRARFHLDIDNRSADAMELELEGDSAELQIEMRPDRVLLQPGERVRTSGRIRGPRHLFGEPRQHSLTVAARSRSAPAYAPATFQQRPVFPRGLRTLVAALLIIGIWGGALGAGYLWWTSRDDDQEQVAAELVDTDGDGVPDTPGDQLVDTDGDGVPDTVASVVAEQVAAAGQQGPPQAGGSDLPTRTSMGGTVAAGDGGQATGVDVTLTPIDVGAAPPAGATQLGFRNGELRELDGGTGTGKFWPARFGRYESDVRSGFRQTESVPDVTATDERGVWFFGSVSVGQSYEVSFSRPGYDTQSFVVTPSADGKPIDLPVEMQPASGSVSGSVTGPNGPLGNVELVLTDGTLVFNSASASAGEEGTFAFSGVSTPGTYSLRANAPGLGTEVVQVTLEAGEQRGGVAIRMRAGVGSISGRVTDAGRPLGGITLTASNGDTTVETTSLTEGDTGSYLFPRLDIPGRWTIEARADGYVTQTRLVTLNGNARGIDFAMVRRTGAITGLVESSNGGPLPGVNIRVSRDDLHFDTQTAVSPDPGSFNVRDLPPGTYLVELTRYDHEPTSQTVTVAPGQVVDLGLLTMVFRPRPDIPQNGGLDVRVVNSEGNPLGGATVRVLRNADGSLVAEQAGAPDQTSFFFQPLPIGTYRVEVTRGVTYRLSSRVVSVGLTNTTVVIPIYLLGQVHGRLIDSATRAELIDYDVQIRRLNPDGTESIVQNLPVTAATPPKAMPPDGHLERRFETANPPGLTSGTYRVVVDNPPPGYRVRPDQVLQPGMPAMQFRIEPDNDTPLDLGSILADRFPEIHGVVLSPRLDDAPPDPRQISFAPIDDDSLHVTLLCPGANPDDEESELQLPNPDPDPTHAFHGSRLTDAVVGSGAGLDSFYIDPVDLEEHDLFGACRLEVSVTGYTTKTFDVVVDAIRGQHAVLHRNVGLVRPRDIAGNAFWIDDGTAAPTEVDAVGVRVRLQGDAVTGFVPGSAPYSSDGSEPTTERELVAEVVTDSQGGWVFPGSLVAPPPNGDPAATVLVPRQVFGEAVYVFELPGQYQPRTVGLTIDENGKQAEGILPDPPPFPLEVSLTGDRIQLDADGAPITARLDIRTVKGSPGQPALSLAGFSAQLTGANTAPGTPVLSGGNSLVQARQSTTVAFPATPDPGTHQWTVTPPATPADGRPRFKPATAADLAASDPFFQPPGTPLSAATVPQLTKTFVEMGAANVQVVDRFGIPVTGAQARIVGGATPIPVTITGADNVVAGLDVPTTPNGSANYRVELPAADNTRLDVATAAVLVFSHSGALVSSCTLGVGDCGTVNVVQGGQPRVRIVVQRYGTLTGTVCGTTTNTRPFTCDETLRVGGVPPLRVTATRIAVRSAFDARTCVTPPGPTVTATVEASPTGSFTFFGPPGYYRVEVAHDDYETIPGEFADQVPQFDHECLILTGDPPFLQPQFLNQPVYQLQNDQVRPALPDPWYVLRLRSDLTVTVYNDTLLPTPGPALVGATVTITPDGQPALPTLTTDGNGQVTRTGANALLPGVYTITVANAGYFPLTVRIDIRRGGGGVGVRIPLPRVGGSITGTVVARNTEGDALLPPVGVVVSDNYDQPDAAVTGATVLAPPPPPTPDPTQPGSRTAAPTTNPLVADYSFTGLGSGTHHLAYAYDNSAGTYRNVPPADVPVTVLSPGVAPAPPAIYTAENRDLVVTLNALDDPSDAQVRLIDPDSAGVPGPPAVLTGCVPADAPETCTARFDDLPPERTDYRVLVTKELYAPLTTAVNIPPGNPAVPVTLEITLTGTTARVTGEVDRIEDEARPPTVNDAADGTSVRLLQMPAGTISQTTTTSGGRGAFTFDIPAEGNYAVEAVVAGYATRRSETFEVGVGGLVRLGRRARLRDPVIVEKLATVSINVSGPPAASVTGVARPSGAGAPAPIPMTRSGSTFTASLDPQWSYRFEFTSSAGYAPAAVPATPVDPAIGEDLDNTRVPDVTMTARTIAGTVTVAPGATPATSGTVRATNAAGVVGSVGDISSTGTFTLTGPFPAGPYTLVAESFGVGRGTLPLTIADTDPDVTGQALALSSRNVATTFASTPAGATVTVMPNGGGTAITGTAGATPLPIPERAFPATFVVSANGSISSAPATLALSSVNEATSDGRWNASALTMTVPPVTLTTRTITGTVDGTTAGTVRAKSSAGAVVGNVDDAAGGFTLTGPFGPDTYTIVAEELGRGRATTSVTVADDAAPSPPSQTLTLSARTVNTTFTSSPAGAAISITTSAASGSTSISGTAGTAIAVPESAFPITYVASLAGYQDTAAAVVNLGPAEAGAAGRWDLESLNQAVTTATLAPRTIAGTVTGATAATVRVPSGATTTVGPVVPGNPGFTLPGPFLAATAYTVVAEQLGLGRGTAPVTTGASSSGSVTGVTIGLTARLVDLTVTITGPPSAAITVSSGTSTWTGPSGTVIQVPETAFPVTIGAIATGFQPLTLPGVALAPTEDPTTRWNATALTMATSGAMTPV